MGKVRYGASVSLDGYAAGADQSVDHPLGVHGELLHEWMRELAAWRKQAGLEGGIENESTEKIAPTGRTGALIMGRNMFGGGPGPWSEEQPWNGWWGDDPPFHLPVFVLTNHPRPPLHMAGGTSFTFVQEGIEAALELAPRGSRRARRHDLRWRYGGEAVPRRRADRRAGDLARAGLARCGRAPVR